MASDEQGGQPPAGEEPIAWKRDSDVAKPQGYPAADADLISGAFLAAYYSGPCPPPSMLREYEALVPGSAKAIIEGATSQTPHRQRLEAKVIEGGLAHEKLGVIIGGVVAVTSIVTGGVVAVFGSPTAGATIATACVLSLVGIFVYGTDSRRKEREAKAELQKKIAESTAPHAPPQTKRPKPDRPRD